MKKLHLSWDGERLPLAMEKDIKDRMPKELKQKVEKCKDEYDLEDIEEYHDFVSGYLIEGLDEAEKRILSEEEADVWVKFYKGHSPAYLRAEVVLEREIPSHGKILGIVVCYNGDSDYPSYSSFLYEKKGEANEDKS